MKYNKRHFSVLLLIIIFLYLVGCSAQSPDKQPRATQGILDLSYWKLDKGTFKLDGEWEFYWDQLSVDNGVYGYINVPSAWNGYKLNNKKLSSNGYATYRLMFKTNSVNHMALYIPRIFTSYKLFVNNNLIAQAGTVGTDRNTSVPQYVPQVAMFDSIEGDNEIIVQVSNYFHRSGGILESLILGDEKSILNYYYLNAAGDLILFGALMIIGAYHLALFLYRKKNKAPFYFGIFCLFVGIRTLLVGERFFNYIFPDFSWEIAHKIQTLSYYLGVPVILMYFKSIFKKKIPDLMVNIVQAVGLAFSTVVILTPARIFTIINPVYQIITFITIIAVSFIFLKILFQKDKNVIGILFGGFCLIFAGLYDMIFLSVWFNDSSSIFLRKIFITGNLSAIGQLIFVFTNSLVLAKKLSYSLDNEEIMTRKLRDINLNLDKVVKERTMQLENTKFKIEQQKAELERTNQALQKLSLLDPLTNLWNRRYYDYTLHSEWNNCLIESKPISLIVLDIDFFKEYNDCYGHKAGDVCLEKISQVIKQYFNDYAIVRYGGEEFVIILPDIGYDDAYDAAEFLRKIVENLKIPHSCSSVNNYVTVSVGFATMIPEEGMSHDELFQKADKSLYQAKTSGRNKVGHCVNIDKERIRKPVETEKSFEYEKTEEFDECS